jgi:hypothetical protein
VNTRFHMSSLHVSGGLGAYIREPQVVLMLPTVFPLGIESARRPL